MTQNFSPAASPSSGGGGSYGGGGGGGGYAPEAPAAPSYDGPNLADMYAQIWAEQQRLAKEQEEKLKKSHQERLARLQTSTAEAGTAVDENAAAATGQLQGTTDEQMRQANISRQRAERALPQASLISGGGGASESALMDINNTYQNSRDKYNTAFTDARANIMNQANNLKAQQKQNLAQWEASDMASLAANEAAIMQSLGQNNVNLMSQIPQYAMQIASMAPQYTNPLAGFNFNTVFGR